MIDAAKRGLGIDTFIIVTDNETWHGSIHPMQALREYRQKSGRQAQLAVVALTSTGFTIADPTDPLTMDFVGFSSDLPKALAAFMKMG
jgi:60 kDa SS-A/Ro ribonucleoprotein